MQQESKFEYLSGNVERVTYHNQENGFAVLRVKVKGHKDLVSVIGTVPSITPGEDITTKGYWRNDVQYGLGFRAEFIQSIPPTPIKLKEINGIGDKRIDKITKNWQEQKIVREIMVFLQSNGVGTTRATRIYKTKNILLLKSCSKNVYYETTSLTTLNNGTV
jgi:exodeoxyribonuclease V alpha subunit